MTDTDCPNCGQTKAACDESAAKGWDGCCASCDERGRRATHARVTTATITAAFASLPEDPHARQARSEAAAAETLRNALEAGR